MKIIITESKLTSIVIDWLDTNFSNLIREYHRPDDYVYYRPAPGERFVFKTYPPNGATQFDYNSVINPMLLLFGLNETLIREVLAWWVKERYKIPVSTITWIG